MTKEDGGGGLSSDAAADREQEETEFALTQGGSDQSFTILASGDSTGVTNASNIYKTHLKLLKMI